MTAGLGRALTGLILSTDLMAAYFVRTVTGGEMFDDFARAFQILVGLALVFVPLGVWKLVEIALWVWRKM
jgi:hypothetical protein